jgi:hypothetical protein
MKVKIEIEIDTVEDRNEIDSFLELLKHISIDTDCNNVNWEGEIENEK